jgi:peptidoglycan/xylan/chitin deacetylase (PgdA/CDA1 family)
MCAAPNPARRIFHAKTAILHDMRKLRVLWLAVCLTLLSALLPYRASADARESVRLPIVMYHHISRDPKAWGPYVISAEELEADLRWLRAHGYETVSVRNLLDWEAGRFDMPEKPCMLTFDDGARSTMAYAEPLLAQYGFCGVSAVIGAVCRKFTENGETDDELSSLSWEAAREMAERGTIEVICHSWDMHALSPRRGCSRRAGESEADYRAALTRDLSRFLTEAEAHGLPVAPAIAYPYGAYSRTTTEAVRDFGFQAAFTCEETVNHLDRTEGELLRLGRFNRPHGAAGEKIFGIWEENC